MFSFFRKKPAQTAGGTGIEPAPEFPFSKTAVFICDKCGKKLSNDMPGGENPSHGFQKKLKKESVERFGHREARVMISSCQNVCPEGKISVALLSVDGSAPTEFLVVEPTALDQARKSLLEKIRVRVGKHTVGRLAE